MSTAMNDALTADAEVPSLAQLRLMQLCSPLLPIGAFAYSQGLEQAAELGWVQTPAELESWLRGVLSNGLCHTDLPLLARARRQWLAALQVPTEGAQVPPAELQRLAEWLLSLRESSELREEEQRLGSALARLLATLDVPCAAGFAGHPAASYVVLYALAAAHWQIDEEAALSGFAFAWLENQIGAACRVLSLGQHKAQFTLSRVLLDIPRAVDTALALPDDAIGACAPGLAMASAWHEEQYSRLFRS